MFNSGKFNSIGFNRLSDESEDYTSSIVQNTLTLAYDADIVPITYIGEQYGFSNSPWVPFSGFYPNQWLYTRDLDVYFAGADGYVHRYGVGTDDNGRRIEARYVMPPIDLGHPDLTKRLRYIDIDAEKLPDSFLRIFYRMDDEEDWTLLCELEQGKQKHPFVEFPRQLFRKISLKFENAHTGCEFILNGVTLDLVVRGQMKEMV
jgi:hypothetical protein